MRFTILFLFISCWMADAISYSQSINLNLSVQNGTILQVIKEIEKQSEFTFVYNVNEVDLNEKVSVNFKNKSIIEILENLFRDKSLGYKITDRHIALFSKATVTQQNVRKVTGLLIDNKGEPIVGANVVENETTNGTVSDIDGSFELTLTTGNLIKISYIGYLQQEIKINPGVTNYRVVLHEDLETLQEVVVVGYGTQKRLNIAGSVSSINATEISKTPVALVSNALAGKMPGLVTLQSSGLPGKDQATLKIRGFDGPLILIDGAEGDLNSIDANEIESVSILKDASAAIYGARAGNGVVLITTKRGNSGKPTLTFNTIFSWQGITDMPKMVSSGQYTEMQRESHIQGGHPESTAPYTEEEVKKFYEGGDPQYPNTDWYGLLIRDWSPQQQHNISVRGGSEKVKYYGFLGYLKQETFFKRSDASYTRYNLRSNIDATITRGLTARMDFSTILNFTKYPTRDVDNNIWGDFWDSLPVHPAVFPDKTKVPYAWGGGTGGAHITTDRDLSGYKDSRSQDLRFIFDLNYEFDLIKGLQAKVLLDYKQNYSSTKTFSKPVPFYKYDYMADLYTYAGSFGSTANLTYNLPSSRQIQTQASLQYKKLINKDHDLNALILFESIDYYNDDVMAARSNFLTAAIDEMLAGSTEGMTNMANTSEMGRMSLVGRLNYSYKDRYIMEATLRADASAKFPSSSRWGYFPSASLAWRVEQEGFMKDFSNLDALKLRISYGASGNDNVGNFQYITGYDITGKNTGGSYVFGNNRYPGIVSKGLPNPELTWEKLKIYNIGADISLWKGAFYGTIDVFYRERTGIPANRLITIPSSFGAGLPAENLNSTNTRGFELMLATSGSYSDFSWDLKANISWARSKWMHYEEPEYADDDQKRQNKRSGNWVDRTFGYLSDGLFTSMDEIKNLPYDQDQRGNETLRPGDVKYLDINSDKVIDWRDQVQIGKGTVPTWMVGFNPSFGYKNVDIDLLFQGALGFDIVAAMKGNSVEYYENRWTETNNDRYALVPRLGGASSNGWSSDYRLVSGNYLRLKSLNMGYTFKNNFLHSINIENLRVYFSGVNLFTISHLKKYALDPESPSGRGGTYYPQQRNLAVGLTLIF